MSDQDRHPDRVELNEREERFVDHLAIEYRAAELTPSERVAFRDELDRRLEAHARTRGWQRASGVATAVLVIALVWSLGTVGPAVDESGVEVAGEVPPEAVSIETTPEEALYALIHEPAESIVALDEEAMDLPDDYEAIASLFLGS